MKICGLFFGSNRQYDELGNALSICFGAHLAPEPVRFSLIPRSKTNSPQTLDRCFCLMRQAKWISLQVHLKMELACEQTIMPKTFADMNDGCIF